MNTLFRTGMITVLLLAGCTPSPRYRMGTPPREVGQETGLSGLTTNDYLRLGQIMRSYLGKPYMGQSRYERGVDCSSFIQEVFKKFDGRGLPRTVTEQYKLGRPTHRRHLQFGDLVFFRTEYQAVSHVGIYTGYGEFIHASSSAGVIISSLKEQYWAKHYVDARRILEPPHSKRSRR